MKNPTSAISSAESGNPCACALHATSRRDFLKRSAAASVALSAAGNVFSQEAEATTAKASVEQRPFGKTDMKVTILGFGSAEIGYGRTDQAIVDRLLNAALDQGLNVVDTAECYADAEEQIGRAIAGRRKDFYLFSKCGHYVKEGGRSEDWSKDAILHSVERSLTRCKTDVLDLILLHSCSLDTLKKGECIEALETAKKQGKVRYIGYSGDSQAAKYAIESGRFDALQTSVNIADQECIDLTLPLAKEKGMGVIAKRPIANAAWRYDADPGGYHSEYWKRLQALQYPFATGDKRGDTGSDGAAGTALRFTAFQPGVSVCIVGTTNPERWRQNAGLLKAGALDEATFTSIRARWQEVAKPDWTGQT